MKDLGSEGTSSPRGRRRALKPYRHSRSPSTLPVDLAARLLSELQLLAGYPLSSAASATLAVVPWVRSSAAVLKSPFSPQKTAHSLNHRSRFFSQEKQFFQQGKAKFQQGI